MLHGTTSLHAGLTSDLFKLIGNENLMTWVYDEPEALHRLMAYLRDDRLTYLNWLEQEGLLGLNNNSTHVGSGSPGFTTALQRPGSAGTLQLKDLWVWIESQETTSISPTMFGEFFLPYMAEVSGRFEGGMRRARRYARQEVWFRTVVAGIERQRTVRLAYFTLERRETTTRDVDPYGLVMHEGAFYLVGFCHLRRDRRTFLMDRVRSAVLTDRRFTRPEGFSPREHLRQAWGVVRAKSLVTVRVRFDRAVAPIIEEGRWHESQRVRPGPEGAVELTVQVAGWDEIRRWIMTFGGTAEVLEPPELRAELKREAAALAARYR